MYLLPATTSAPSQGIPSYVRGDVRARLNESTLGDYFEQAAAVNGDRPALVVSHQAVRWTYTELHARVTALAAGLLRLGLRPGERIGIWSQNCAEWVLTQFATAKAGLVLVNINPAYRAAELQYALRKSGCKALILAPRYKSSDYLAILREVVPELETASPGDLRSQALPQLRCVIRLSEVPAAGRTSEAVLGRSVLGEAVLGEAAGAGLLRFNDLLAPPAEADLVRLAACSRKLRCTDPINIQFTSGTTGAPKGATLSHRNLLNNGFFVGEAMRLSSDDRVCIPVPLYHCFGMVIGNLACITHGATMVLPSEGFEPRAVLDAIQAERCTALHGVPTMFIALLEHPKFDQYNLASLRTGVMAGAPCPIEVMKRVVERMHMREVTIAYGMTETSPISFQSSINDPPERRVLSVGLIQPHVEVKIVDESGNTVPRGTPGEVLTRGYSVMLGYWDDPAKTREAIDAEGWMHTGDLATLDENGYCNIVGRSKDMVIRGGENIYPREVEEFLYRHPKVQDVQVVGVPDARYGEELCACIILRPGTQATVAEIREFCVGQIARFKIPRHVRFLDRFPMTVTGKVPKYVLRQQIADEMGLQAVQTA
jgi:fatty-acyl-CoA synthase